MRQELLVYAGAVVAVVIATALTFFVRPLVGGSVSLLFFPAIVIPAMYGGYGPALVSTVLSTVSLAFFFTPPLYSLNVGLDDFIRLLVFASVALLTASLSAGRKRAEDAHHQATAELQSAVKTIKQVSDWPVLVDSDTAVGLRRILDHAASVVGAVRAVVVWELEEEPWIYVATSSSTTDPMVRHAPGDWIATVDSAAEKATFVADHWHGRPINPRIAELLPEPGVASAPFHTDYLSGRAFFSGLTSVATALIPVVEVVAREIGGSLDQLHINQERHRLTVREERIRLARDLHDGVLQSLTGIRLELQTIAGEPESGSPVKDRLFAIERAIAIEQRELRLFIDSMKPAAEQTPATGTIAQRLDEICGRLRRDWKVPITVRVSPSDLTVPAAQEQTARLMVQEAIVNALKHAHPTRIGVDVTGREGRLQIVVKDDGRGFPFRGRLDREALVAAGVGPASIRERVGALGGQLTIESTPSGSTLEIVLP
jgi:signal transduction histidine kinase